MSRVQPNNDNAEHAAGYSKLDEHRSHDEHTYLLRTVLFGFLTVTAVVYGVGVYIGLSSTQNQYASKEFRSLSAQVGTDIRNSFDKSVQALTFLAERYATNFPDESEWPTVLLPGFEKDIPYLRDSSNLEIFFFAPIIKFEDINRTEIFMMDAWADNPLIPFGAGLFPIPGFYGLNESAGNAIYKDTRKVDWPAQYEVITPLAQVLFDREVPPFFLGQDFHSIGQFARVVEETMSCVYSHNYSFARDNCDRVTPLQPYDPGNLSPEVTVQSNLVVPVMLNQNSSQLVGMVGGQFQWGKIISALIPDHVSGIHIVLRTQGDTVTYLLENGQAHFLSVGDTHGNRYAEYKYVETGIVISGTDTCTIEFYPQQHFIDARTDNTPIYLAVGTGLFILLCTLLFFLYDVPMRNSAIRTEVVLETKRRFVRFISHEIRTPLNTVNMGLTLFDLELVCIHDAVGQLVTVLQEQGQTAFEVAQSSILQKIDELQGIARDVTASTEEAVVVLNDLLNFDKMESGVFVLELAFVAVGEVVQRSMASFLLQARDKDVRLTMQTIVEAGGAPSPTSPSARGGRARSSAEWMESGLAGECELDARYQLIGDGSRLGQVLRKLISNAMKFTNAGGAVNVTVQRVRDGMPGEVGIALPEDKRHLLAFPRAGSVRINLVDSGAGLSEQQVLDIGQENLQFNVSTHQGGGGSGLGLFISKGLVQQHGGKMTVTSPGLGLGVSTMLEFPLFDCFDPSAPRRSPMRHSLRNSLQFSFRAPSMSDLVEKSGQISQEETSKEDEVGLGLGAGRSGGLARVPYPLTIRPPVTGGHVGIADGLDPPQRPQALIRTALSTPEAARPAPAPASASASASASPGGGRHMLVVDDAVSNRKLLMRIFRLKGFVCEEAYDGQDALDKYANMCAQNTPPFAILMDYEMPVLNGPASTIQLRERGCTAFILGVTGNVMKDDKDFFVSCGADDVFIKPLNAKVVDSLMQFISSPRSMPGDQEDMLSHSDLSLQSRSPSQSSLALPKHVNGGAVGTGGNGAPVTAVTAGAQAQGATRTAQRTDG